MEPGVGVHQNFTAALTVLFHGSIHVVVVFVG